MPIVNIKPNTFEWDLWRGTGIGASEAPIIMGVSPYCTALQLFNEKSTGIKKDNSDKEFIFQKGHDLEAYGRVIFNEKFNLNMIPEMWESANHSFLHASLDGRDGNTIWEGKYMGKKNFELVKETGAPLVHHYPQIQHQLYVSGADFCYYMVYLDNMNDWFVCKVYPDIDYIGVLVAKEINFWNMLVEKKAPELSNKDEVQVKNEKLIELLEAYEHNYIKLQSLKAIEDGLKEEIKMLKTHSKMRHKNITITESITKGTVDYKKIPFGDDIDLEKYRRKDSVRTTIRIGKLDN